MEDIMKRTVTKMTLVIASALLVGGCIGRQLPPTNQAQAGAAINEASGAQPGPAGWEPGLKPGVTLGAAPQGSDWSRGIGNRPVLTTNAPANP